MWLLLEENSKYFGFSSRLVYLSFLNICLPVFMLLPLPLQTGLGAAQT